MVLRSWEARCGKVQLSIVSHNVAVGVVAVEQSVENAATHAVHRVARGTLRTRTHCSTVREMRHMRR